MSVYYNEIDPFCVEWLKNLIKKGLIANGDVDGRSIKNVQPSDLRGYTQCHFFAGIGLWSYALRQAGVSDDESVWTGSCPCQPFSSAGKQKGKEDERHLWPEWFRLIRECKPPVLFGEQVAAAIRLGWLDIVQSDLEGEGYAIGKAVLGAGSVGAPHIRQRLYFVADSRTQESRWLSSGQRETISQIRVGSANEHLADPECGTAKRRGSELDGTSGRVQNPQEQRQRIWNDSGNGKFFSDMANSAELRCEERRAAEGVEVQRKCSERSREYTQSREDGKLSRGFEGLRGIGVALGDAFNSGLQGHGRSIDLDDSEGRQREKRYGPTAGFWSDTEWLYCRDGKYRPTKPGLFPLVNGDTKRVGRLRAYGNAIVPQVATEFIKTYREIS